VDELDSLWAPTKGAKGWYDRAPVELQTFCQELAARIVEKGQEPVWANVIRHLDANFPDEILPKSKHTIQEAVRRLVKEAK
jgi:hypothetical protein